MTWFVVDDSFHSHPKALAAGPAAVGLWTIAGTWSCANLTDGFVPDYVLPRLAEGAQELARTLVAAGLWRRARGGHRFHDWDTYQRSREEVLNERRKWAEKKAKQRDEKRTNGNRPSSERVMSPGDTQGDTSGESKAPHSHSHSSTSPDGEVKEAPPASPGPPKGSRGTRLPNDFAVTEDMAAWAREKAPSCGPTDHEQFCDYWRGIAGAKGRKADWPATWRNWMRREHERRTSGRRPGSAVVPIDRRQQATNDRHERAMERARQLDAMEARGEP